MNLTEEEIKAIEYEADCYACDHSQIEGRRAALRQAYSAALAQERLKAKVLAQKAERFMSAIPIDNGNWHLDWFDESLTELKKVISDYNKLKQ